MLYTWIFHENPQIIHNMSLVTSDPVFRRKLLDQGNTRWRFLQGDIP